MFLLFLYVGDILTECLRGERCPLTGNVPVSRKFNCGAGFNVDEWKIAVASFAGKGKTLDTDYALK